MNTWRACFVLMLSSVVAIPPAFAEMAGTEEAADPQQESGDLRARLTEREDEIEVEQPWTTSLFGHPLSATVQYELSADWLRQYREDDPPEDETRVLLEQEVEGEMFYTTGPRFSLLLQAQAGTEDDLLADTRRGVSTRFIERGEFWLYSEHAVGPGFASLEIGRLDFEDDRRWWWDEDLDALRITVGTGPVELALAVAREVAPTRSDRDFIEAEHEAVARVIAEASWDWHANHSLQLFALWHDDRSRSHELDEVVEFEREDESDAKLRWVGARSSGAWVSPSAGIVGYWLDAGWVRGNERTIEFAPSAPGSSVVDERGQRTVRGRGFDAGLTWIMPLDVEPRFTLGVARGSGDADRDDGEDRSFRQTGLNGNAPGFGGVQSFPGYGRVLEPDLSNLQIVTIGAGITPGHGNSLDLVYHRYRQVEASDSLDEARLVAELNGSDRDLGDGLDLVLAIEAFERIEFELSLAAFRAGDAFGAQRGRWTYGGFSAFRVAF